MYRYILNNAQVLGDRIPPFLRENSPFFSFFLVLLLVRNTIFRKAPPSVVSDYGKRSINFNKVVATFEKHIFLSQIDLTRTEIISNSYDEMFEA
jgi:hypothetical protein